MTSKRERTPNDMAEMNFDNLFRTEGPASCALSNTVIAGSQYQTVNTLTALIENTTNKKIKLYTMTTLNDNPHRDRVSLSLDVVGTLAHCTKAKFMQRIPMDHCQWIKRAITIDLGTKSVTDFQALHTPNGFAKNSDIF